MYIYTHIYIYLYIEIYRHIYIHGYMCIYILSRAADPCPTGPDGIANAIRKLRPGCGPKKAMCFPIAAPLSFQVTKVKYGAEINPKQLNLT